MGSHGQQTADIRVANIATSRFRGCLPYSQTGFTKRSSEPRLDYHSQVISDGQESLCNAVRTALPGVPHQLCQFHYLREAAKAIFEADRHAKVLLKKAVRGVRPIERALEGRDDEAARAARGYCLAVRSALTDDGRPPLCASGLRLHERLTAIRASLDRVAEKGGSRKNPTASGSSSRAASPRPPTTGRPSAPPTPGSTGRRTCSRIAPGSRARRSAPTTERYWAR